jgi:hypothetical protein
VERGLRSPDDLDQRALELELAREPARPLESRVELGEADDRLVELVA